MICLSSSGYQHDKAGTLYQSSSWEMRLVRELLEIRVTEEAINSEGFSERGLASSD